jgi:hypothetical protein
MRTLSPGAAAAISAGTVVPALLVEMDLDEAMLALNHSRLDLLINGTTYLGTHGLGQVAAVATKTAEMPKISFSMSGVPSDKVAFALTENVQGRECRIKLALFDNGTGAVLDVALCFAGWLNVLGLTDGRSGATISVTAESGSRDLLRACGILYSHEDQQALVPGDLAWQFNADQVEQRIVFPAREWFLKNPE